MRLGLLVEIIDNPHLMQMQAVLTKPEDLVIGMSISGETEAVLDALRTAGLHHTETVLITACRKQHFQEQFGQILTVPAVEGVSGGQYIPAAAVPHNYGRDLQPFYGNGFQVQDGAFSGYADRYREKRKRTERDGG